MLTLVSLGFCQLAMVWKSQRRVCSVRKARDAMNAMQFNLFTSPDVLVKCFLYPKSKHGPFSLINAVN